jgi:hypothetical protein
MIVGDREKLAFAIGKNNPNSQLRKVEIYLLGKIITNENNMAYLPSFIWALHCDIKQLKERNAVSAMGFMELEDITDSFHLRVLLNNGRLIIKQFKNQQMSIACILPVGYVIQTFTQAVKVLEACNA